MDGRHCPRTRARRLLIVAMSLAAVGCSSREPAGLGVRRAAGSARSLVATTDGVWLAFLDACNAARASSLPLGTSSCELRVVPAAGGEPVLVARATTTLPGAVLASPVGAEIAALAEYDYASGSGTLVRWRPGTAPEALASGVTFRGYGADGTLGYIAGGAFFLAAPGGGDPRDVDGVTAAASFELAPGPLAVVGLVRRKVSAGGELLPLGRGRDGSMGAPSPLPGPVGDYGFGRGSYAFTRIGKDGAELKVVAADQAEARPELVARGVRSFAFEPGGDALAYVANVAPGRQGDLRLRAGRVDVALGRDVGEFRWAARAPRLAWLEGYDPRVRSGSVGAGGVGVPGRIFGKDVSDLEISPDGRFVAFLQHSSRGGYSVTLFLADLGAPEGATPRRIAQGSFGFSFSPDGRWLYYRTRCTREGEACDLERLDVVAAAAEPERVAEGVKSFEYAPGAPGRLLLTWKPLGREALDVGIWEGGRIVKVDTSVLPGSASFIGPGARRLAYAVLQPKRAGVYVAEIPGS